MAKSHTQNPLHTTPIPAGEGEEREALLDEYVLSHSDPEPDYLYRLWRATNVHILHGRMASGRLQGRLLRMLVQMARPRNIIEVGTFSGYSALCMAEGLAEGGHLYTFEINDEMEPFTRPWIENSPWSDRISFIIGDAATEARKMGVMFDMAFIDGDKRHYVETYEALMPLMNPGAFILADNTLWDGHVTDPDYDNDRQTLGIRRFNDHIAADKRVTRVILPLRDGLTVIRITGSQTV
ncbi:MAG: O-methyltransferase [Prevotellaceae bacterium]|nr:O-methyltransferase [Prevotellaceae bacterium]